MSLVEQPEDTLRVQLEQLDALSLLRACHSNTTINRICQDNYFWLNRLRTEFPTVSVPIDISQARKTYLGLTLFNGEIYKDQELKHKGPILYDDIAQWTNMNEDITFYSRPLWNKEDVDSPFMIDVLGVAWAYNPRYLTADRPTQIDIIPKNAVINYLSSHLFEHDTLSLLNYKQQLPMFAQDQYYTIQTVGIYGVTGTKTMQGDELISRVDRASDLVVKLLTSIHKSPNRPVYQRYINDMHQRALINLSSPKIPTDSPHQLLDISQRKLLLLQRIKDSVARLVTYNVIDKTGYPTYDMFIEAQNVAVNALTDEQLTVLELVLQIIVVKEVIYFNKQGELKTYFD